MASSSQNIGRRQFIAGTAAAAAAFTIVPRHVLGGPGETAPSEKMNLAGVGIGGVAHGFLKQCDGTMRIRTLCDVDDVYGAKSFNLWPEAERFRDFREMFDKLDDQIDAVLIGTPDHTHAIVCMESLRRKKHTCCVKPLTRTIEECRTVVAAAKAAGVATQVTASPNTSESASRTCELIWSGAIGDITEVHVWSNRPLWPQGMQRPKGEDPVPDTFDWDLWLGPAPRRPFVNQWPADSLEVAQVAAHQRGVYHPWNFRGWFDFGTGALGDMGCHRFNTMFRALKLDYPTSVDATSTRVLSESFPLGSIVTYEFPAREGMPPLRVVWYDGGLKPPKPKAWGDKPLPPEGELYFGTNGVMFRNDILDAALAKKVETLPKTLERRGGTFPEWFEAIETGRRPGCDFAWNGLTTEAVLLGNIAIRTGKKLNWDAAAMRFTNDDDANRYVLADYQNGWKLGE